MPAMAWSALWNEKEYQNTALNTALKQCKSGITPVFKILSQKQCDKKKSNQTYADMQNLKQNETHMERKLHYNYLII